MKLKPTILTRMGDETIAVPIGSSKEVLRGILRMNKTAADIWSGLVEEKSPEEIAAGLVEKYDDVDLPRALDRVELMLTQLKELELLED